MGKWVWVDFATPTCHYGSRYHPYHLLPLLHQDHPCSQPIALTYSDEKEGERERSWVCESEIEKNY